MAKHTQVLEVKFDNAAEQTYEYLYEMEHPPIDKELDLEKNLLFAVVNREEFLDPKTKEVKSIPLCDAPNIYRVVRVVKVKEVDEQEYEGYLRHVVTIFTPIDYIERIQKQKRLQTLRRTLERKKKRLEEERKLTELAGSDDVLKAILEEIKSLSD